MKTDENADCAGICTSSFPTGLCFFFLRGIEIVKGILINSDFGWGQI
jgi:hypothetical protein